MPSAAFSSVRSLLRLEDSARPGNADLAAASRVCNPALGIQFLAALGGFGPAWRGTHYSKLSSNSRIFRISAR